VEEQRRITVATRLVKLTAMLEDGILVLLLSVMIALGITQIVLRNLFHSGLLWGDACLRVLVLWVGMLGAVAATRDDKQITVDVLSRVLPKRWRAGVRVITDLFTAGVAGVVTVVSWQMMLVDYEFATVAFAKVPAWVCELVVPFAFAVIALRYLSFAVVHTKQSFTADAQPHQGASSS